MAGYHIHEGLIELPAGWDDRTMNIFSRELAPNQVASIVVTRDDMDVPLSVFVDRSLKSITKQLPRFVLSKRGARTFGAIEGEEAAFQWRREGVDIYQRQAFLPVSETRVLTFTVSVPVKYRAEADAELTTLLSDLKLRRATA